MDVPWKVIFAFVGVFIAGAIFGGVFTIGVSARRFANNPRLNQPTERPVTQLPPVTPPKTQVAGPQAPGPIAATQSRANPITPQLMNRFTKRLSGLNGEQKDSLRKILGRAGEDYHRLRQENLSDVTRVTERMYADISSVLTLEQRTELEAMRKQDEERFQNERRKRTEAAEAANRAAKEQQPVARPNTTPAPPP